MESPLLYTAFKSELNKASPEQTRSVIFIQKSVHKLWRHLLCTLSCPPDAFPPGYICPGQTRGWGKVFLNEHSGGGGVSLTKGG